MIIPKKLLVVRTDRIGDVVLSLPIGEEIKKKVPGCYIALMVRRYTLPLVQNHPFYDEIIVLEEENNKVAISKNIRNIKKYNFDSCIIVYPTFITALIIFLSRIKNRISTGYRWYLFLFNHKIFEHRKYAEKHELEFNLSLLKAFGIEKNYSPDQIRFNLQVDESSRTEVKNKLYGSNDTGGRLVVIIHPGSGGSSIDLPLNKFKDIIRWLKDNHDVKIILTGDNNERELCEQLKVTSDIINLAGKLSLKELIALIDNCSIFISNSTGPLHIAAALNKFTIGFYPKILACSAERWGPYSTNSIVFKPEIDCHDCDREQCIRLDCMNSINLNEVFKVIDNKLKTLIRNGVLNAK